MKEFPPSEKMQKLDEETAFGILRRRGGHWTTWGRLMELNINMFQKSKI